MKHIPKNLPFLSVALLTLYVLFFVVASYSRNDSLKLGANVVAVCFTLFLLFFTLNSCKGSLLKAGRGYYLNYGLFFIVVFLSGVENGVWGDSANVADAAKIVFAPMFYIIALNSQSSGDLVPSVALKIAIACLVIPLLLGVVEYIGFLPRLGERMFSVFSNKNNASLFAISLIGLYAFAYNREIGANLLTFSVCLIFGSIGILAATCMSFFVIYRLSLKLILVAILAVISVGVVVLLGLENVGRVQEVVGAILAVEFSDIVELSYGEIVAITGTSDVSFFFRIKHWAEIVEIFAADPSKWVLGYGIGASKMLTTAGLVPHNDYLRILFECGFAGLVLFVSMMVQILRSIDLDYRALSFVVVLFYFFSENILNNYVAMWLVFYMAGLLALRRWNERVRIEGEGFEGAAGQ